MYTFLFISMSWACDPDIGTPNAIYPSNNSNNIAVDTHILFEMIHMYSEYIEYEVTLQKISTTEENTEENTEEVSTHATLECSQTIGWDGICWVRLEPDAHLLPNQKYQVNVFDSWYETSIMQSVFTTGTEILDDDISALSPPIISYIEQIYSSEDNFCGIPAQYRFYVEIENLSPLSDADLSYFLYLYESDAMGETTIQRNKYRIESEMMNGHLDFPDTSQGNGCFFAQVVNIKGEVLSESEVVCVEENTNATDPSTEPSTEPSTDPSTEPSSEEIDENTNYPTDDLRDDQDSSKQGGCSTTTNTPIISFVFAMLFVYFRKRY